MPKGGVSRRSGRRSEPSDELYGPAEAALRLFAVQANKSSLHPLDWERFYRFVVSAHQFRKGWNHSDVKRLLVEYGFTESRARDLSEAYWHGRCSLHVSKNVSRRPRYADWARKGRTLLN
jgi:hypothetical protein